MRRRVWCETVPTGELAAPSTVALLRRYELHPIVAVWPDTLAEARATVCRFADAGLAPALWPMLPDRDGRWIGATNADTFCAFAERVASEGAAREIVLDLEPPIAALRASIAAPMGAPPPNPCSRLAQATAMHVLPTPVDRRTFHRSRDRIAALASRLHTVGAAVSAAVAVPVLFDRPGAVPGWQLRLGTPVDGIAWDHVSPMLYTSIIEGWSRGLLDRDAARAMLAWGCRETSARFGPIAGASLGAVGTGAFGDEPTYRSPDELSDDVATARAAGVDDLALFDLGGVLRRPPVEAWLEAFTTTAPAESLPTSWRVRGLVAGAQAAGNLFGLGYAVRAPQASPSFCFNRAASW
jgi:hypothetical protein